MQELIAKIVSQLGIDQALAEKAVGALLSVLNDNADQGDMGQLMAALPGAGDLLAQFQEGAGGDGGGGLLGGLGSALGSSGLGGALGGALGGTLSTLMKSGLDQDQLQQVVPMAIDFAKEKAGDDLVGRMMASVPGLDAMG